MNTAIVDLVQSGIAATSAMPWQYQAGLAAAGLLVGLGAWFATRIRSKKNTTPPV